MDQSDDTQDKGWGGRLENDVLTAYLCMIRSLDYYFSVNELVSICKAVNANIIVAQRYSDRYIVEHFSLEGPGEVAVVAIDSSVGGRVAAHFERLLCSTTTEEEKESQQEVEHLAYRLVETTQGHS